VTMGGWSASASPASEVCCTPGNVASGEKVPEV
jgi:hypothetical protein